MKLLIQTWIWNERQSVCPFPKRIVPCTKSFRKSSRNFLLTINQKNHPEEGSEIIFPLSPTTVNSFLIFLSSIIYKKYILKTGRCSFIASSFLAPKSRLSWPLYFKRFRLYNCWWRDCPWESKMFNSVVPGFYSLDARNSCPNCDKHSVSWGRQITSK